MRNYIKLHTSCQEEYSWADHIRKELPNSPANFVPLPGLNLSFIHAGKTQIKVTETWIIIQTPTRLLNWPLCSTNMGHPKPPGRSLQTRISLEKLHIEKDTELAMWTQQGLLKQDQHYSEILIRSRVLWSGILNVQYKIQNYSVYKEDVGIMKDAKTIIINMVQEINEWQNKFSVGK